MLPAVYDFFYVELFTHFLQKKKKLKSLKLLLKFFSNIKNFKTNFIYKKTIFYFQDKNIL